MLDKTKSLIAYLRTSGPLDTELLNLVADAQAEVEYIAGPLGYGQRLSYSAQHLAIHDYVRDHLGRYLKSSDLLDAIDVHYTDNGIKAVAHLRTGANITFFNVFREGDRWASAPPILTID